MVLTACRCSSQSPSREARRRSKVKYYIFWYVDIMTSVLCIAFKSALWLGVRNRVITHRKLPLLHCYHIFCITRGLYLAKNHYENYSPQMVPMAQILGPGSRTNTNFLSRFHLSQRFSCIGNHFDLKGIFKQWALRLYAGWYLTGGGHVLTRLGRPSLELIQWSLGVMPVIPLTVERILSVSQWVSDNKLCTNNNAALLSRCSLYLTRA